MLQYRGEEDRSKRADAAERLNRLLERLRRIDALKLFDRVANGEGDIGGADIDVGDSGRLGAGRTVSHDELVA